MENYKSQPSTFSKWTGEFEPISLVDMPRFEKRLSQVSQGIRENPLNNVKDSNSFRLSALEVQMSINEESNRFVAVLNRNGKRSWVVLKSYDLR